MKNIRERAKEYCKSTLVGSNYIKGNAYVQGAKDVLQELAMTLSVSNLAISFFLDIFAYIGKT